jgi:hypothetical protein
VNVWKETQEEERFIKQRNIFIITFRHFSKLKFKAKNQKVNKTLVILKVKYCREKRA